MSDLISRRAAIEAIENVSCSDGNGISALKCEAIDDAVRTIRKLPSAQPERNTGNWNIIHGNIVVCSECGMAALETMTGCLVNRHLEPNRTNFCPHCGARMEK